MTTETRSMKPVLSARGRKVLDKALAAMQKYPETVEMGDWLSHDPLVRSTPRRPKPYCGTVACLAGHIVLAARGTRPSPSEEDVVPDLALAALGVPEDERQPIEGKLFYSWLWPKQFRGRYHLASTSRAGAAVVIARVRHWLKTGE